MLPSSQAAMRDSRASARRIGFGRAHARAALLGNPSDGFGGRTLGFAFAEFAAEVTLRAGEPHGPAPPEARPLIEAAIARLRRERAIEVPPAGATLRTTIPREVGLGGSSAIVIATLRAACALAGARLEPASLAKVALAVETVDLGIPAGPQDRLIQAHEGLLYMDFSRSPSGRCEPLDPNSLPPLFVAWTPDAGEPSAAVHNRLRRRHRAGDRETLAGLAELSELAAAGCRCLADGDPAALEPLLARNLGARARLLDLDPRHLRLAELARELGAPSNYAGSGGAIVGLLPDGGAIGALREPFAAEGWGLCQATPVGGPFSA